MYTHQQQGIFFENMVPPKNGRFRTSFSLSAATKKRKSASTAGQSVFRAASIAPVAKIVVLELVYITSMVGF